MTGLTTDPQDPRLGRYSSDRRGQDETYLVLSEEERALGFVRPVRKSYIHVGLQPQYPLRDLTEDEHQRYDQYGYTKYEAYPEDSGRGIGRFWTQTQLSSGCQSVTTMGTALAETYARDPKFYGATFCVRCNKHLPVEEFVWTGTDQRVGS